MCGKCTYIVLFNQLSSSVSLYFEGFINVFIVRLYLLKKSIKVIFECEKNILEIEETN